MPRSSFQALLLVDGYNMVGIWPDLRQMRDQEGMEAARRSLIEALSNYSAFQGFETQIVFDSHYQDTPGNRDVITHSLSVLYTEFGQTADTHIEKACAAFRHDVRKFRQRLIVATSDRAQQLTVVGYGAEWMSAERLANDVELVGHRIQRKQKTSKRSPQRFLAHSLDAKAQQKLADLRLGLRSNLE